MTERRRLMPFGRRHEDVPPELRAGMPRAALWMVGLVVGVGLAVAIVVPDALRQRALQRSLIEDCREDNLPAGYLRLRALDFPALRLTPPDAEVVLPILWCRRTVQEGRPVRLPKGEEAKYLRVLRGERLPVVDGATGRVVGAEALPAHR